MLRRAILAAPLAVAACSGAPMPPTQTIAVVAQDVQIIADGLSRAMTQIAALGVKGLTPALLDICQSALSGISSVAKAIGATTSVADAQPLVVRVEGYVNSFVGALSLLPLPAEIKTALVAATVLLPVIEAAVNIAVPAASTAMTPDQARTALK